ncbi:MAG: methyltransferase family protein [Phenylobacterium sp.]
MNPAVAVPQLLVLLLIGVEIYAGRLRRAEAERKDRGSLYVIYGLIALGYWAAFWLWARRPPPPRLGDWSLWAGATIAVLGLALRLWSVITLGQYFTYVVKVTPDQKVVDTGPYRLIRHPSYAGALLAGVGIGLSLGYALAPVIIGATSLAAYVIRILVEESALAEGIGEPYRRYMGRTRRLIPFVW